MSVNERERERDRERERERERDFELINFIYLTIYLSIL